MILTTAGHRIELDLIAKLIDLKYAHRADICDRLRLEANFHEKCVRYQLEKDFH